MTRSQKLADLIRSGATVVWIDQCQYVKHESLRKGMVKIEGTTSRAIYNNLRKTNQQQLARSAA